ncbi:NAD(P)/FAD-dependent oxidoreductase [Neoroseomonas soli]|uniref:FAD-binding oxidoreductase n=1 Tax=Neoroseomonas soli TaxID=1081025 RepID=A0A9X9X0Z7_9PROT|nr:FAD-dependent oxidoreductase [Neoroseomonas soli]MBR0673076.1 FAD-binding oxidoreductase [Neoroseomonas soli]
MPGSADVVIIGGGAIGCAVACFLRMRNNAPRVTVIERDPTYALASTPRASGGVRRLFSGPENIQLSNFSIPFYERFAEEMAVDGVPAEISFRKGGYLFIVDGRGTRLLEESAATQRAHGVRIDLLDRAALKHRFPSMFVDDLELAAHSLDDAWVDPHGVQQGFRRKARDLGAEFLPEEAAAIERDGARIRAVRFASGGSMTTRFVVNAAGAWADQVCAMAGMRSPIRPMRRFEHYFECETAIEPLPYVKDLDRLAFRPEGRGYTGGMPDSDEPRGFNFEVDHGYFERVVWPALAHRFPAFERTREKSVMAGLYDQNELDGNAIIGPWPDCPGFLMAAGFSGHGLMHAPGVGRAIAELILDGGYQTIDLARLGWDRVLRNEPYRERGIL